MKKKIIISITSILILSFILIRGVIIFYPTPYLAKPNYLEISDIDDNYLYSHIKNTSGKYITLEEVSPTFITTLIAIEDKRFYDHHGLDYLRIIKSGFDNLISSSLAEGASTITQQVARMIYLSNEKTFSRKIEEAIIAQKIEEKYSKKEILEFYINSIYFAHNLYGIDAASNFYFQKAPKELTYKESTMLVGILNAPNIYSPIIDFEACLNKQKQIAYQLYHNKIISVQEYYDIISFPPKIYGETIIEDVITPYYHQGILRELEAKNIYNNSSASLGLNIKSYLDMEIQNSIQKTMEKYAFDDQVAIVVMKPYSGRILALAGGKNYYESQYNRALDSKRQIGSTIKPLIYYQGLLGGLTPLSKFTSEPTSFTLEDGTIYAPRNANNIYANRKISMIEAIAMSDNIYSVKSTLFVGSSSIVSLIKQFGIDITNYNLTLSLGTAEMTPLELASIYNTFASEGIYYPPSFIDKVTRADNIPLYQHTANGKRIFAKEECIMMNYMLQAPLDSALSTYSTPTMKNYQVGSSFCVKTGTTSSSSWTVGFNPLYTILVYVGDDDNLSLKDGSISKKLWRDIAITLMQDQEDSFYHYPSTLTPFKFINHQYECYSKDYLRRKD